MRPVPSRDQLKDFVSRSRNFDAETVGVLLKAKLNTNDWKVKLKALAALEAVAKDGSGIAQYFVQQCPSDVLENLSSAQATLKAQAQKT